MLFIVNWVAFKATSVFLLPTGKTDQYYDTIGEMRECISALIFMVVAVYFLNLKDGCRAASMDVSANALPSQADRLMEGA